MPSAWPRLSERENHDVQWPTSKPRIPAQRCPFCNGKAGSTSMASQMLRPRAGLSVLSRLSFQERADNAIFPLLRYLQGSPLFQATGTLAKCHVQNFWASCHGSGPRNTTAHCKRPLPGYVSIKTSGESRTLAGHNEGLMMINCSPVAQTA